MPLSNQNVGLQNVGMNDPVQGLDYQFPSSVYNNAYTDTGAPNATPMTTPTDTSGGNSIINDISSILGGPGGIGNLALYGGAGALLSSEAQSANKQNQTLAGQIGAIGQPSLNAGNQMLSKYQSGTLTTPFQNQLNAALAQINQQQTSQTQSAAQALANSGGGANIQSAQLGQNQQAAAQAQMLTEQAVSNAFTGELSAAEGLIGTGGAYVQSGILTEIQSNQQLQQQLQQLFSGLASAYAQSQGGGAGGGNRSGSGQNPYGSIIRTIENQLKGNSNLGQSLQDTANSQFADAAASGPADYGLAQNIGDPGFINAAADPTGTIIAPQVGDVLTPDAVGGAADATDLGSFGGGSAAADATGAGASAADLGYTAVQGGDLAAVGTGSNIAMNASDAAAVDAAGSGGAGAALAGLGTGVGALYGAYLLGNYLTAQDAPTPQESASTFSNEMFNNPNTNALQRARQVASGFTPYTGTTDAQAEAWLQAMTGAQGMGGGTGLAHAAQGQA